jgi:hypothetical protein
MAKKMRLDFTKVEERSGWNTRHIPEGLHQMKVAAVEDTEAQDGTDMWVFALVPTEGKYATRRFPFYCKLQTNQLWKVRDLFVAAGIPVPKKATMLDPNKVVGKLIAVEVIDEKGQYEGRSSAQGTYGLDVLDGLDAPEDEPEDDEEEYDEEAEDEVDEEYEDEEEEDEEDLEALTLPELRKLAKSFGIDTTGLKKAELIEAIEEEQDAEEDDEDEDDLDDEDLEDEELDDEEFEDDEEDEEPEPAPKRRAAPTRKAAPAKAAPAAKRTVRRR